MTLTDSFWPNLTIQAGTGPHKYWLARSSDVLSSPEPAEPSPFKPKPRPSKIEKKLIILTRLTTLINLFQCFKSF
jgi:hypothetical protein